MKEREIKALIESLGGVVIAIRSSKHWRVDAEFGSTVLTNLIFPMSGSDWRQTQNQRAFIRRRLREANDNKEPPHREVMRGSR